MTALLPTRSEQRTVCAAVAPLLGDARIAAVLTSQYTAGTVVDVLEHQAEWLRVRGEDGYVGWTHQGYVEPTIGTEQAWRRSLGCVVCEANGVVRALPLGARLRPDAVLLQGESVSAGELAALFGRDGASIGHTASTRFTGASYLWGGVTPWGCDCSGFVQTVFALHGLLLPRDAWQQALVGEGEAGDATAAYASGALLFFSDRDDRKVTHVGVSLGDGRMAHSALRRGGVAVEQLRADDPYVARLRANFTGARRVL